MGLLSPAMKAELRKTNPEVFPALELGLPDRPRRYASAGLATSNGFYEPRVKSWGRVRRAVSLAQCSLEFGETEVELIDHDRDFSRLLGGPNLSRIRNSPAVIRLLSPNVPFEESFVLFSGVVDRWAHASLLTFKLTLRASDTTLTRFFPAAAITEQDYPDADPSALGQYMPLLYGLHTSGAVTGTGMLPTLKVGKTTYLLCLGRTRAVRAVYKDGKVVTDYTVQYRERNGKLVTEIEFASDQGDASITVDAEGYETIGGAGGGSLITNPARQLEHLLTNFVIGQYRRGTWLPTATQLHAPSFAFTADFLSQKGLAGARYLSGDQRRGVEALNDWCESFFMKPFLTASGQLGVKPLDHRSAVVYVDDPWLKTEEISGFEPSYDPTSLAKRISAQYLYGSVERKYLRTLEVADLSVPDAEGTKSREIPWSAAEG